MLIVMATSAIYVTSYYSQYNPREIKAISETLKEMLDLTPGIDGVRIYNFGPDDAKIAVAMLVDGLDGSVIKINSSMSLTVPSQEYIDVEWDDIGLPTPNIDDSIILVTESGKKFVFSPVYKQSTKSPVSILKLSGRDIDLFIYINGEGSSENILVIASNIGLPVNPTYVEINGTKIDLDFSTSLPPSTTVKYVSELKLEDDECEHEEEEYIIEETSYMDVNDPAFISDSSEDTLVQWIINYITNNMEPHECGDCKHEDEIEYEHGYLNVTITIKGVLADGRLFEYTGTFDIIFDEIEYKNGQLEVENLYIQPSGLVQITSGDEHHGHHD
jgi:hypothetical protein